MMYMVSIKALNSREPDKISQIFDIHKQYCSENGNGELTVGLKEDLEDTRSIVIVANNEKGEICGYLLAIEHNHACELFKDFDPLLQEDPKRYYVDLLEIVEELKNPKVPINLILSMVQEAAKRGIFGFSMHIRASLSEKFMHLIRKRIHTNVRQVRKVSGNWYGSAEEFVYIEGTIK